MTEKLICKKTGRPFPERLQKDGENFVFLREEFERLAPENSNGSDLPVVEHRSVGWVQNHLCEGLIEKPGDWMKLAEDPTWWGWAAGELQSGGGDWNTLQNRMRGMIKKKLIAIETKMMYQ